MRRDLVLGSRRELGTVALVGALSGAYAAVLVTASSMLVTVADATGGRGPIAAVLAAVSTVFILIALYVAAVVIANAVDTVIAGRLQQIALLRLLGARAGALRGTVTRSTGLAGLLGALAGSLVGIAVADLLRVWLVHRATIPALDYPVTSGYVVVPAVVIAVTALLAGRVGSRAVLRVSPVAAMGTAQVAAPPRRRSSVLRGTLSLLLLLAGAGLLAFGAAKGEDNDTVGLFAAFFGAAVSGTGVLVGGRLIVPALVARFGRLFGSQPASEIARRNAVADRLRTTRSTMGLVIGVTLVTTIASGMTSLQTWADGLTGLSPQDRALTDQVIAMTTTILLALVVISAVIAAVGFVSTLSLTVIHRRREIGLLRALGFTGRQVRAMVTRESAALAGTAVLFGLVLGLVYGSVGAQSVIGGQADGFVWGLPWTTLLVIAVAGLLLVLAAAAPPARRAVRVTPIEALRVDR